MTRRLVAALVLPFALTGCGNDDSPGADDRDTKDTPTVATTSATAGDPVPGEVSAEDKSAIEETILEFLVTGDCDLATDGYLRELSFLADESTSREEACTQWENAFVKPLFTKDDVNLTELKGTDGVATVLVGSDLAPGITTLYQLTLVERSWLVSGDEYNTDGL